MSVAQWEIGSENDFDVFDGEPETQVEKVATEEGTKLEIPVNTNPVILAEEFDDFFPDEDESTEEVAEDSTAPSGKIDSKFFKAKVEYYSNKYNVEIPEVEDWTEESYIEFEEQLLNHISDERYNETKKANPIIEKILSVAENGGDLKEIIGLVEEREQMLEFDTTTLEGKLSKIKAYYKLEGKPDGWINKHLSRLQVGDTEADVEEELEIVNQQYEEYFQQEQENIVKAAETEKKRKDTVLKTQITNFNTVLESKQFKKKESDELVDYVFKNKYTIRGTDQKITEFEAEVYKRKNNPEKLADLVLFLKDEEGFKNRIITEAKNKTNDNTFKKIISKKDDSISKTEPTEKTKTKFTFQIK